MSSSPFFWRSLSERAGAPELGEQRHNEFNLPELVPGPSLGRRSFLGLSGLTAAAAAASLSGCIRKPEERILPYSKRPEDLIPGSPRYYATAAQIGSAVIGLLVESQDGRPTKIEGNPKHPLSRGAASAWAQAEVMNLYDADRSRTPLRQGTPSSWDQYDAFISETLPRFRQSGGAGLGLLVQSRLSPTFQRLLADFARLYPQARLYEFDPSSAAQSRAALSLLGAAGVLPTYHLEKAQVLVALDADFLCTEGDVVANARGFALGRALGSAPLAMNRLYVVEPSLTTTGGAADNRLRLRASEIGPFVACLAVELGARGLALPPALQGALTAYRARKESYGRWTEALAKDLLSHPGQSLLWVGERQPPWVQALGWMLNQALGNLGNAVELIPLPAGPAAANLQALVQDMRQGKLQSLVILSANPVYESPADYDFAALLKALPLSIHLSRSVDETSRLATWHLPASHFLEAWGDHQASDGTVSIQQPLIAPLFDTRSEIEVLAHLSGASSPRGYALVRSYWAEQTRLAEADFERGWRKWLHDGVAGISAASPVKPGWNWDALTRALPAPQPPAASDQLELNFRLDPSVLDGRYANNPWLQEAPDPITKISWDNAACFSPKTAEALGLQQEDWVQLTYQGRSLKASACIVPGQADGTVLLTLGYGRSSGGRAAKGAGFNAYLLRGSQAPYFDTGVAVQKLAGQYPLACTQEHGSMEGRDIVRQASFEQYRAEGKEAVRGPEHPPLESIWKPSNQREGHQWGMSIDLNACLGCNACVIACQSENNVPVVGKEQVRKSREMHWLRIDRYFGGPIEEPQLLTQPMLCQHCEMAPCENVCPVNATSHSAEGLNDMVYNRCIGTRYCSNNCPYKVRRFNFFNYNNDLDPLVRMQKNPDVTVRFRGVMEKCTYCVQRIQEAKIQAKVQGTDQIPDGKIVPACAQTCPTQAIVFGDVNDANSLVSKRKRLDRDYSVLEELNTRPRTTYLAKIRNPNPELV